MSEKRFLPVIFLIVVFIISLTKIADPDAWLHLSMGKLIWTTGSLPAEDLYTYTNAGRPFSYSSWLFGLLYYMAYLGLGVYGITLLKASTVTAAYFFMTRDALRPYGGRIVTVFVLSAGLLISRERFVERPDTFLMLFLSFSIFSLNAFLYERKKYIYALPFVHMLWANSHSSVVLSVVPFAAFAAGGLLENILARRGIRFENTALSQGSCFAPARGRSPRQLKTLALVFAVSLAASLISPYFLSQYTHGSQFFSTLWYKEEILELQPPSGVFRAVVLATAAAVLASFIVARKSLSLFHILLFIPFALLSMKSMRFVFLSAIVGGPLLARNLSSLGPLRVFARKKGVTDPGDKKVVSAVALWLIAFGALSVLGVRPFSHAYARPGFGFDHVFMPAGAVDYMEANGIDGRVMNTFHFGQYITFRRYPKNTVFVDGRGYIPAELLEKLDRSLVFNHILNGLSETYNFDSMLIESPDISFTPASAGFRHPEWALVYWDDTSKLYLKRGPWPGAPWLGAPRWDALIHRDEYLSIAPDEPITPFMKRARAAGSKAGTAIELELLRSVSQTGSARSRIMLGAFYLATDRPAKALESLPVFRPDMPNTTGFAAYVLAGDAYLQSGKPAEGVLFYKKALRIGKDPEIVFKIGGAYMAMNENRKAVRYFNKALKMDDKMIHVYPLLIYAYQGLGMSKDADQARVKYNEQKRRIGSYGPAKTLFDEGFSAYKEKNYDVAIEKFTGALDISPSNPDIHSNMAYVYYDTGRFSDAEGHFRRALELDPRHANANYGIALVYVKLGDKKNALRHLKLYLEIEPTGYFSRTAREQIAELSRGHGPQRPATGRSETGSQR